MVPQMNLGDTTTQIKPDDGWAKTDPESGLPCLSVPAHCRTVGVVARVLLSALPPALQSRFPEGSLTLVAAHDIGKLTPGFQIKAQAWRFFQAVFDSIQHNRLCTNHAIISQWHLDQRLKNSDARYWLVATGGHHGRYPLGFKARVPRCDRSEGGMEETFANLREALLDNLIQEFGPLPEEPAKTEKERIHLLTGFTIFSDWVGSNTDWFPAEHPTSPEALEKTATACLRRLRWRIGPRPGLDFGQQFSHENAEAFKPRDIQQALLDAADSPGLYIVEAPMGLGKTEAALTAAYRRWTEGDEKGLYFALPTQLTSNRIHERVNDFLRNTLGSEAVETLIHGNAWLLDGRNRRLVSPRHGGGPEAAEEGNDVEEALRWFGSTRKQLLAPYGTGTIDQALLAVLPARFAALRYFALSGKVVVIDEVHSFDSYMSALIDRLIRHLIKAGSTVIILSATLTAARRRELVQAVGAEENETSDAYPLITKVAAGATTAELIPVNNDLQEKTVRFENFFQTDDNEAYWEGIAAKVEAGANVVVIRNTVALAQATYLRLRSLLSENISAEHIGLLHSRFPQHLREKNEARWTALLGKINSSRPSGSLIVSTQIVEQSVDIDADFLVTDLAPVDLVLQRVGRLHRHQRQRPRGFEKPVCHLLHPIRDWTGDSRAIKQALAPHHHIYPAISLWRAALQLSARQSVRLPIEIRETLENAYAMEPDPSESQALADLAKENANKNSQLCGTAKVRDVYEAMAIEDREGAETRYGMQPTAQLILLRQRPVERGRFVLLKLKEGEDQEFHAVEFSFDLAKALHQAATRIPAYLVATHLKAAPDWLRNHIDNAVLAVAADDSTQLTLVHGETGAYQIHFREDLGVWHEKIEEVTSPLAEEDFWF